MSLAKPASIARVSIASHRTSSIYSRKTFLFCSPLCLWMLSNKLKIRESHQRNLQTLKLENMTRNSELQNFTPDNRCCTSKPRQWGKGNKREVEFHPVMASTLVKPRHASDQYLLGIKEEYNHNFMIPGTPNFRILMLMAFLN